MPYRPTNLGRYLTYGYVWLQAGGGLPACHLSRTNRHRPACEAHHRGQGHQLGYCVSRFCPPSMERIPHCWCVVHSEFGTVRPRGHRQADPGWTNGGQWEEFDTQGLTFVCAVFFSPRSCCPCLARAVLVAAKPSPSHSVITHNSSLPRCCFSASGLSLAAWTIISCSALTVSLLWGSHSLYLIQVWTLGEPTL